MVEEQKYFSKLALASLFLGLLSGPLSFAAGIPAVITGYLACKHIRSGTNLKGAGIARIGISSGLILSILSLIGMWQADLKRKRLKSGNTVNALATAIASYMEDYRKVPDYGAADFLCHGDYGRRLMTIIRGREPVSDSMSNPLQRMYLNWMEPRPDDILRGEGDEIVGLIDAWRQPLHVILHPGDSSVLRYPHGEQTHELTGLGVIVASHGRDGIQGTKDDIVSAIKVIP